MRCHVFVLSLLVVASNHSNASLYTVIKTGWKIYEVTGYDHQNVTTDIERMAYEICDKFSNDSLPKFALALSEELVVLNNYLVEINTHCKLLLRYNRNYRSMIGFAKSLILNDVDSVVNLIQKVHSFFSKPKNPQDSILSDVDHALKNMGNSVCSLKDSPSQSLVKLINVFAGAEIKGFALVQFSYALLNYYDNVSDRERQSRYRTDFKFRLYKIVASSREVIEGASKDVWRCDPKVHVEGRTYEQFTRFLQGYIQHELFLNEYHSCSDSCERYYNTTVHKYEAKNIDQFSKYQECPGKVLHCQSLHPEMSVCPSKIGSSRRYDFVRYPNGEIMGRRKKCSQTKHDLSNWLFFTLFGYECSYCFCFCEAEDNLTDRLVSMRSSLADINNNRVVTGVRFAKRNKIIHIQVQEGKLIRRGRIDKDTVRWVPLTNFSKFSEDAYLYQDYYRLTPETCTMYLDDIVVDPQHIVTGLRFKMLGTDLLLEILTSPYDFETGQLIQPYDRSFWKDNLSPVEIRQEILLEEPDMPTIKGPQHVYNKRSQRSIRFTSTDVKKDLAQTTVPFFDAQPVSSGTPAPLEGVGIFHKGRKGSGGFVAMKLITFDYSRHIPNEFSRGTE